MFNFLKKLISPPRSSFVIEEVDHFRNVVVVEDKQFSLRIEIPIDNKPLKHATIVAPYDILLTYIDGSQQKKKILN